MPQEALELVRLRNEFYRDNYRRVMFALLFMIVINAALLGIIYYQLTHRPLPQYFATTADGKIVKLHSLSEPVISTNVLSEWAVRAAVTANTYDFVNYRKSLLALQDKFTPEGWKDFESAIKTSRNLETVIAKKLVVTAVATGAPVILDRGVINNRYVWKVNLPILVTYESATELTQQPLVLTMIISRVPTANYPDGIAIVSFVEAEGKPAT